MWRTPATRQHPRKPITPHGNRRVQARENLLAKRRRVRIALAGLVGAVVVGVICGASVLSYLPALAVHTLTTKGLQTIHENTFTHTIYTQTASAYWGLFSKQNIALYPTRSLEVALAYEFPRIKTVDVHRAGMHEVVAIVSEREPWALWCGETGLESTPCFYVDETGFVFEQAPNVREDLPGIIATLPEGETLRAQIAPEYFAHIVALARAVENETELSVRSINITENELVLHINPDWALKINLDDTENFLSSFKAILDTDGLRARIEEVEYIDMRFGERIYYRLRQG